MRVLALACYPERAAATRFRLVQLVAPLAERGIELVVRTALDDETFRTLYDRSAWRSTLAGMVRSAGRTARVPWQARAADVLLVQREAMLFGPPLVELAARRLGRCPMVLDLDDATYVGYRSPTFGAAARLLKWPGKTDQLIRRAALVTCGSRVILDHAEALGARSVLLPTVVDTDRFRPLAPTTAREGPPIVGWVGTHSTFPFLRDILPALAALARRHEFTLRVVGAGVPSLDVPGLDLENLGWRPEREVADFQTLDIGLYPITDSPWAAGKSGLKSIQYMAVGVPFVASPVGAAGEIGREGVTHLTARSPAEWESAVARLLVDVGARRAMGAAGREHALAHYTLSSVADRLAAALDDVVGPG